ncbi:TPA: MFS transporter [Enterobacter hormaechei subsp. hoffmannii]
MDGWVCAAGICCLSLKVYPPSCWVLPPGLFFAIVRTRLTGLTRNRKNGWKRRLKPSVNSKKNIGHQTTWQLLRHRQIWLLALIYAGASSAGTTISVWSPQLLKSFHLDNLETGLFNAIPYGLASVLMIVWGRSSDRTNERRWHTALTLFIIAAGVFAAFVSVSLSATIVILSIMLIGAYSMKGPFWALASGWMSSTSAAAGLAAIGAIANLIGGAVMVNAYGIINERTGSHTLAMLPLAALCVTGGIAVLVMGRQARNAQLHEKQVTH